MNINALERVYSREIKFIVNDMFCNYRNRIISLNLLPLMFWIEFLDILFLVKCFKQPTENINVTYYLFQHKQDIHL